MHTGQTGTPSHTNFGHQHTVHAVTTHSVSSHLIPLGCMTASMHVCFFTAVTDIWRGSPSFGNFQEIQRRLPIKQLPRTLYMLTAACRSSWSTAGRRPSALVVSCGLVRNEARGKLQGNACRGFIYNSCMCKCNHLRSVQQSKLLIVLANLNI